MVGLWSAHVIAFNFIDMNTKHTSPRNEREMNFRTKISMNRTSQAFIILFYDLFKCRNYIGSNMNLIGGECISLYDHINFTHSLVCFFFKLIERNSNNVANQNMNGHWKCWMKIVQEKRIKKKRGRKEKENKKSDTGKKSMRVFVPVLCRRDLRTNFPNRW